MAFFSFLYRQAYVHPPPAPSGIDLSGYTILVTGSNVGLGLEATRQLVSFNVARVILGVRTLSKGEDAKASLLKTNPRCQIDVWELDLESFDSVMAFGKRAQGVDRIDIVLLNAGLFKLEYTTAKATGHETTVQVNHLSTSLLSLLLLPVIKSTAKKTGKPSRLTLTSSEVHMWTKFHERKAPNILERMDEKDSFGNPDRYNASKLLNVLWTRELASKVNPKSVVINTANPGLCHSSLHRDDDSKGLKMFKKVFARTTVEGGRILVDASVVKGSDTHAAYLSECKVVP